MIKLPKYFKADSYINLNRDLYKINPIDHFKNFGYKENRKYNELINPNYPIYLHFNNTYDYFYDLLIDFKLKNIKISPNFSNNLLLYNVISSIIINSKHNFIDKGIYSDRDLIKNLLHDEFKLLLKTYINNKPKENIYLIPNNIFKIENKFRFFYEYFKFHTVYIKKIGFEIINNPNNINTAVIVETRNHIMFKYIVYNIMYNLGNNWNLHIFCGYDNHDYVKFTFPNVKITLLPFYNLSVDLYDFIFMNNFFWNAIDTENILIFQTDTFLVSPPTNIINNNYPYIGAPHSNIHGGISFLTPRQFGLNGGFSFRKKSIMLYCIKNVSPTDIDNYRLSNNMQKIFRTNIQIENIDIDFFINNFNVNKSNLNFDLIFEDVYFSHCIEILNLTKASLYIAKHFIIQEDINGLIYNVNGVHGWDKPYLQLNYFKNLLKKYTYNLLYPCSLLQAPDSRLLNKQQIIEDNINILIICHNMGGGTEKYIRDIINITNNKLNNLNIDIIRIKESNSDHTKILFNNIDYLLIDKYDSLIKSNYYHFIHINYFNEPAFILYDIVLNLFNSDHKPKLIITLHDYHFIINNKYEDYHLNIYNSSIEHLTIIKNDLTNLLKFKKFKLLFETANLIITGSSLLKNIYNFIFDLSNDLIKVVEHPEKIYFNPITVSNYNSLNICVIGAISIGKGSHIVQDMSVYIKDKNVPWTINHIGAGINLKKNSHYINLLGSYNSELHLKTLLIEHNINLLWYPAYRHESYCYTLSLGIQTGLPIIAYNTGTFKDRLSSYNHPYYIHKKQYKCQLLFEELYDFWINLRGGSEACEQFPAEFVACERLQNNTHINENHHFQYDDFNYKQLYI